MLAMSPARWWDTPFPNCIKQKQEPKLFLLLTRHSLRSGPTSCAHCLWFVPLQLALQAMHVVLVSCFWCYSIIPAQHKMLCAGYMCNANLCNLQDQTLAQLSKSATSCSMGCMAPSSQNVHLDLPTTVYMLCEKQSM